MRLAGRVAVAGFGIVVAILAGCSGGATASSTTGPTPPPVAPPAPPPSYAAYTQSYTLPWVGSPNFANLTSLLQVQAQVGGAVAANFVVATGSVGIVMPASALPNIPPGSPSGTASYTATGLVLSGVWVTEPVNFPQAVNASGVTTTATATVPVLAVTSATCTGSGVDASSCTTTIPYLLGVGFGIDTTVATSPPYNPFLNLAEMTAGTMRRGYIIERAGLVLGLTTADVGSSFVMQQLSSAGTPASGTHNDWGLISGGFETTANGWVSGTALLDTALLNAILENSAMPQSGTVASGTAVSFAISTQSYGFSVSDGGAQTPTSVNWAVASHGTYVNTGLRALGHFDLLYDADGGYFGLRPE